MAKLYTPNTWTDELLASDPRYDILEDGGGAYKADMQINLSTSVVIAGTAADADHMNNIEDGIDAIDTRADITNLTAKTSLADADETNIVDSAASGAHKKITWANIKAAVWSAIHAATSKSTPVDADELPLLDSAGSYGINRLTITNLKAFLKAYFDGLYVDGWIDPGETWTRASNTTFTVSGDVTAKYTAGVKIKWTQNSTVRYNYVVSSSYGAPNTTVTVAPASDYPISSGYAISANYYSRVENPAGFPDWLNYTPTYGGFSVNPSNCVTRFKVSGRQVTVYVSMQTGGTSNATSFTVTAPIAAATVTNQVWFNAWGSAQDNGSYLTAAGRVYISSAGTVFSLNKDMAAGTWTSSGGKGAYFTITYEI